MTDGAIVLSPRVGEPDRFRRALSCFPSGVTVVAAVDEAGTPRGMAANAFTSVSLDPPLVAVCPARSSSTWPVLRSRPRLGVSVLAADQSAVSRALSAPAADRFRDVDWTVTDGGAVLVEAASAWMECEIETEVGAGDHFIVVLRLRALGGDPGRRPLVFHASGFHSVGPTRDAAPSR